MADRRTFLKGTMEAGMALGTWPLLAAAAERPKTFRWGVNGHPVAQVGYRQVPLETQLDLVAELGAGWYRCDWSETGWKAEGERYERLVDLAAERSVQILPVIFPRLNGRGDAEPDAVQAEAREFAQAIAKHFRGKVSHWELDNELDAVAMVRKGETCRDGTLWQWGDPAGDSANHYEERRYQRIAAELRGLHEGIKLGDPEARTIVDCAGWLHTGFMDRLVGEDHVPFDILAWHWYSEMGDITKVQGKTDVWAKLRSFGKPVWVTEINRRGGSMGGKEQDQADYLAGAAKQYRSLPDCGAFFVYELLDEPYFGADNAESHYGLVRLEKGADGKWQVAGRKAAFAALQAAFGGR